MTDSHDIGRYLELADAKFVQFEFAEGDAREELFVEIKDLLLQVEQIEPGAGAWKLACASARVGNYTLCRRWLARGLSKDRLPPRVEMETSPYMTAVSKESWFLSILHQAK